MLTATFSRIMRVFTGADVSSTSPIGQCAMYSGRGRGCDHDRDRNFEGGYGLFRAGHNFTGGRQSAPNKGPRRCKHCEQSNHISEKCWEKFDRLSGHSQLILILLPLVILIFLHLLILILLTLSLLYYRRRSVIDYVSKSSLRIVIQQLMYSLQVCTPILPLHKNHGF